MSRLHPMAISRDRQDRSKKRVSMKNGHPVITNTLGGKLEVGDQNLAIAPSGAFLRGVMELDLLDMEASEHRSHLGNVIEG